MPAIPQQKGLSRIILLILATLASTSVAAMGNNENISGRYDGVESVVLRVPDWKVELGRTHLDNGVELETDGMDSGLYDIDIQQRRGELTVEVTVRPGLRLFTARSPKIILLLPESVNVDAESASGDIVMDARVNGVIDIRSASGEVSGADLRGTIHVRTASGDIRFDRVQGELSAISASGDIRIDQSEGLLSLESASGSIELRSSVANIEAKSNSGDIRLYNFEVFDSARFTTSSGDISIELMGDVDDFRFSARTVSGDIRIFNQRAQRSLEAGTGALMVEIISSSGDIRVY
jgi:hypothetical protein